MSHGRWMSYSRHLQPLELHLLSRRREEKTLRSAGIPCNEWEMIFAQEVALPLLTRSQPGAKQLRPARARTTQCFEVVLTYPNSLMGPLVDVFWSIEVPRWSTGLGAGEYGGRANTLTQQVCVCGFNESIFSHFHILGDDAAGATRGPLATPHSPIVERVSWTFWIHSSSV